jgi:hypothetical protein
MSTTGAKTQRTFDARPDTMDFRDKLYVPTLIEVPTHVPYTDYLAYKVPVLDQGTEGACTGFGLATVANYLLLRRRVIPDPIPVSPRMLYAMAKRYDEWPGEQYAGSSARGAMKGWHKHGICSEDEWPYRVEATDKEGPGGLNDARTASARHRPLGAYFRVNHNDLISMHTAIAEVGVLYATASVHEGWEDVGSDGKIPQSARTLGGHAFAIVAYDDEGFWLQNSWGTDWGMGGLARVSYDDWLENGTDVWVARLGAPVTLRRAVSTAEAHAPAAAQSVAYSYADVRPHLVSIGNDGRLNLGGDYGTSKTELRAIFEDDIPRVIDPWSKKRLLLYAHGGLVSEQAAVQRLAEYRPVLLGSEVYPLAFVWRSDYWTTITNILQDAIRRRRPEGPLDAAKDFLLDRLDDALEPLARVLTGRSVWNEMKENALAASAPGGGADLVLEHLARLKGHYPELEIHVVGHSAGAELHAPLVRRLTATGEIRDGWLSGQTGIGLTVASCTLWAPACTVARFKEAYLPVITAGRVEQFALFALSDKAEQDDDCAGIYNKSLLYLVSNAFEALPRIPGLLGGTVGRDGVPILGMEKFIRRDDKILELFSSPRADLVIAPNTDPAGSPAASQAQHHGDFDDDDRTVRATFARIVGGPLTGAADGARAEPGVPTIEFQRSKASQRDRRLSIDRRTQPSALR